MSVVQEISRWVEGKPGWFSDAVQSLPDSLELAFDSGVRRILLPVGGVQDSATIARELSAKFQSGMYADTVDAV
jgi:ATP-dependent Lon protease